MAATTLYPNALPGPARTFTAKASNVIFTQTLTLLNRDGSYLLEERANEPGLLDRSHVLILDGND